MRRRLVPTVLAASLLLGLIAWWHGRAQVEVTSEPAAPPPPPPPRPPSPVLTESAGVATGEVDTSKVTIGFVRVPAGSFYMGSDGLEEGRSPDEARHRVEISYDFEIQATEVTQGEYKKVIGKNPSYSPECGDDCPVEQVSWFEAAHYCNELSRRRGLPVCTVLDEKRPSWKGTLCAGFRLPTEAEWEHAARAGLDSPRYGALADIAWIDTNSGMKTHPVAMKKPNRLGLFDMLGNVFEWTWDWMGPYGGEFVADPTGPATGQNKVFRGGAYRWTKDEARFAFRNAYGPLNKVEFVGFRCARVLR